MFTKSAHFQMSPHAKRPFKRKTVVQRITDIPSPAKKRSPAVLTVGKKNYSKYAGLFEEPVLPNVFSLGM